MDDSFVKDALKDWYGRFHSTALPTVFARDIEIPHFKHVNKVIVVVGPRRSGKTYLLYQIMHHFLQQGKSIQDLLYVNFEDERLSSIRKEQLRLVMDAYLELYPERKPIVFLDEIQNVDGWEQFVRRLNDEGYSLYITGSNSKMLSREIATSLRGRDYSIQVLPFSFREFVRYNGIVLSKNWEYSPAKKGVRKLFDEYIRLSGFPEIVMEKKIDFIDEYFKSMLYRDVIERNRFQNTTLLSLLMKYLIRNYSHDYSINGFNNFAKSNGYKSSTSVILKYTKALEDAYFCFFVTAKKKSFKKESSYLKKAYLVDQGFAAYYTAKADFDMGRILENIVLIELIRREKSVNYYTNGFECDFITSESAIQVCHFVNAENKKREIQGLAEAQKKFGVKNTLFLTYDQEEEIEGIKTIPTWKWLLQ